MYRPEIIRDISLALVAAAMLGWLGAPVMASQHDEGHEHHHQPAESVDHSQHEQAMDHSQHQAENAAEDDPHAHHRAMMGQKGYQRSEHAYPLKDFELVSMAGEETSLLKELDTDRPVMVNFIFTTCTTICPVMSGIFAQVQKELGPASSEVRMISVSIDPEYDTPERLREYAERFEAGPQWQFLTGDIDDVVAVQKSFDVYRGNKMSHEPTTLLRKSASDPWVRLDGIASADEIVAEYRQLAER